MTSKSFDITRFNTTALQVHGTNELQVYDPVRSDIDPLLFALCVTVFAILFVLIMGCFLVE